MRISYSVARRLLTPKAIVVVGMPGSGKTTIGKKLAENLGLAFVDADTIIEKDLGLSIVDIFAKLGEPAFREHERETIARILRGPQCLLSPGGGAFMNDASRALIKKEAVSLWLKADLDVLWERTRFDTNRPLLKNGDPREILEKLMKEREDIYAQADLTIVTENVPVEQITKRVLDAMTDAQLLSF